MAVNIKIREQLPPDSIVLNNQSYDNAIIGVTFDGRVIYDFNLMVEELMIDDGCNYEDAVEWVEYNTIRALPYMGNKAPIVVRKEN